MPIEDYNKKKQLDVDSVSGTPTVGKAQPIILSGGGGSFDVSTASFTDDFDVSGQDGSPEGVAFSDTGDKMFVAGRLSDSVFQYSLSSSFDVSTASFTDSFDVSGEAARIKDLAFSTDGSKMFVIDGVDDAVVEYSLSTSFDVSTASFTDDFDVSGQDIITTGFNFSSSGDKMFVTGSDNNTVYEYNLSTSFDVSTASFTDSFDVSGEDTAPTGVAFSDTGDKMFVAGGDDDSVYEYSLRTDDSKTGNGDIVIDFSNVSGAEDIAVYDQNGNLLDYEIESLDTTNKTGVLWAYNDWVRDGTTQAQLAYGNNSANTDRQNATGTWNHSGQNAVMVQQLNGNVTDSTSNNNDGTVSGATSISTTFDGAYSFDGNGDSIDWSRDVLLDASLNEFTVAVWANWTGSTGDGEDDVLVSERTFGSGREGWWFFHNDDTSDIWSVTTNGTANILKINFKNEMAQYVGTFDTTEIEAFIDGTSQGTQATGGQASRSVAPTRIGAKGPGNHSGEERYWNGSVTDVRFYSDKKSASWIQADFDASPKAGQVFFSQQGAEGVGEAGSTFTVAAAEGLGVNDNEKKFSDSVFNEVAGLSADTSLAVSKVLGEGFAIVDDFRATGPVTGTVTLNGSPVEGAVVYAFNNTQDTFVGSTTTDVNGRYAFPGVEFNGDEILVAVDHDTGTGRFGDEKSTVV